MLLISIAYHPSYDIPGRRFRMSGGGLTDSRYNLYYIKDWARTVRDDNPVLSLHLMDLYELLDRYDYYLAGDIGRDDIEEAWEKYRDKWLDVDLEVFKQIVMKECSDIIDSCLKGYTRHCDWYRCRRLPLVPIGARSFWPRPGS